MNFFYRFIVLFFLFIYPILGEEVITTKKEEPDGYYGLKLGAIITPTASLRIRDKASGTTDLSPSDKSGFSMPWTMFSISKEWEDLGLKAEFWGEILRNDALTNDTSVGSGTKENPYIFLVRRANLAKTFELGNTKHQIQFGMFELPHMFSVWSGNYDWRYIDKSPLESLGFARDPVDLGINYIGRWKSFSVQAAVVNGEGYRNVQNTTNTGYDVIGKIGWEPTWTENLKTGLHLLGRASNAFGYASDECREGKTKCLLDDGNPNTRRQGPVSLNQEQVLAIESHLLWKDTVNFGLGGMFKKQLGGKIVDRLSPYQPGVMVPESTGRGAYLWLGIGNGTLRLVARGEVATGGPSPGLRATETVEREPWVRFQPGTTEPRYSDQSYYVSRQIFGEWFLSTSTRLALGYTEVRSYDTKGEPNKWYVDSTGESSNRVEYREQFSKPVAFPISEFGRLDRSIVLKATATF
ncbi:hypothetical protein [Leptospira biflexa]|uniref:hypothetical protein n=1 Tax=Leptospira biflexa TaxID=172 RepID=UPI001084338F|nr:hypothetical protein [Leptospira biflexa]TGM37332.1 hypothetical protein EHQ80_06930 [Leptospira biflexa]TGM40669.1 hypothetical protein EHQ89_01495 [Leptospira biflexa]